jgi:hypothetical protein
MEDEDIDLSDYPEITPEQFAKAVVQCGGLQSPKNKPLKHDRLALVSPPQSQFAPVILNSDRLNSDRWCINLNPRHWGESYPAQNLGKCTTQTTLKRLSFAVGRHTKQTFRSYLELPKA